VSSNFEGNTSNLLPNTFLIPQDPVQKDLMLRRYLDQIATAVNDKDSAIYDGLETITGQQFYPTFPGTESTNSVYREVYRKVIDCGTLPSSASSTTAHGITTTQDFTFVKIYGTSTDPGVSTITSSIPLPYMNTTTPGDSVELSINATDVIITTTTANYAAYTRTFVVLEWMTQL